MEFNQTKVKIPLALLLALSISVGVMAAMTREGTGTTITVNTTSDVIASDGVCSLREAIVAANTDNPFQGCPAGSGADTIVFDPSLPGPTIFTLAIGGTNEDGALTGDLDIAGNLTISATHSITVDGDGLDRIFEILPGAHATISGLTVRHGNPGTAADGGGVAVGLTAVLTLTHGRVISNTAMRGGGIVALGRLTLSDAEVDGNQGGGISNDGGLLTLNDVQIRNNIGRGVRVENAASLTFINGQVSGNQGGGIYGSASTVTLSGVDIVGNTGGGGVFSTAPGTRPAWLGMSACAVVSNTATNGAGVLSQGIGARASIYDTDIRGNVATSAGGGVFNNGLMTLSASTIRGNQARSGGGIDHFGGNLTMVNNTLSSNSAGDNGGGLYNRSDASLTNLTISGNVAGGPETGGNIFNDTALVSLVNTIVTGSEADGNCFNSEGTINSLGHNLDSGNTCGFAATGDITSTNPLLGPLGNNGGPTPTHALDAGSPAIDAGDDSECPASDQRGVTRPAGASCDIGSYEYAPDAGADLAIEKQASSDVLLAGTTFTYTVSVDNLGPNAAAGVVVTDVLPSQVTFVGASGQGWLCSFDDSLVACGATTLPVGGAPVINIKVIAPETSGTLTNTATVGSNAVDPNLANNSASVQSVVRPVHSVHLPVLMRLTP
jgi:uncharacterized repeat protein (TIGR01451 family)/CSLREA domain-containing protein